MYYVWCLLDFCSKCQASKIYDLLILQQTFDLPKGGHTNLPEMLNKWPHPLGFCRCAAWFGRCCPTLPSPCKPQPHAVRFWAGDLRGQMLPSCQAGQNHCSPMCRAAHRKITVNSKEGTKQTNKFWNKTPKWEHKGVQSLQSACLSFFRQCTHVLVTSRNSNNLETLQVAWKLKHKSPSSFSTVTKLVEMTWFWQKKCNEVT